jgi:hypothetical protein
MSRTAAVNESLYAPKADRLKEHLPYVHTGKVCKNYTREAKHRRHEDIDYKTKMSDTSQPQINLKRSQSS